LAGDEAGRRLKAVGPTLSAVTASASGACSAGAAQLPAGASPAAAIVAAVVETPPEAGIIIAILGMQRRARLCQRVSLRAGRRGRPIRRSGARLLWSATGTCRRSTSPSSCPAMSSVFASGHRAADVRLLEVSGLECDEAVLTGESAVAEKTVAARARDSPLDLASCAFMGTVVHAGEGRAGRRPDGLAHRLWRHRAAPRRASGETAFPTRSANYSRMLFIITALLAVPSS